jgi:hypothetical protein
MSFDDGRQGLAQRYSIQGLRLAQASGNRALGALILSNRSRMPITSETPPRRWL